MLYVAAKENMPILKNFVDTLLKEAGSNKTVDDLFEFEYGYDDDAKERYDDYLDYPQHYDRDTDTYIEDSPPLTMKEYEKKTGTLGSTIKIKPKSGNDEIDLQDLFKSLFAVYENH